MSRPVGAVLALAVLLVGGGCSATPGRDDPTSYRSTAAPVTFARPNTPAAPARTAAPTPADSPASSPTSGFRPEQSDPPALQTTELPGITPLTSPAALGTTQLTDRTDPVIVGAAVAAQYWTRRADDSQTDNWAIRVAPLCTAQLAQQLAAQQLKTPGRSPADVQTAQVERAAPRPYPTPTLLRLTIAVQLLIEQSAASGSATVLTLNVTMQKQHNGHWLADALISQAN